MPRSRHRQIFTFSALSSFYIYSIRLLQEAGFERPLSGSSAETEMQHFDPYVCKKLKIDNVQIGFMRKEKRISNILKTIDWYLYVSDCLTLCIIPEQCFKHSCFVGGLPRHKTAMLRTDRQTNGLNDTARGEIPITSPQRGTNYTWVAKILQQCSGTIF